MKFTAKIRMQMVAYSLAVWLNCGSAQASVIGSIWENQPVGAGNAIPANIPNTTPNVTFSTNTPINFASGGLYTIGEFLASGNGSTILTGSSELGNTMADTIFSFTGTVSVTNGEMFTIGHDDGVTLIIGGITVIDEPGATAFVNTTQTYTGPTGTFEFQLVYGECCGGPADLSISLPLLTSSTPEPGVGALCGAGFLGLAAVVLMRRRRCGEC